MQMTDEQRAVISHSDLVTAARNWLYSSSVGCSVVITDMASGASETPDAIGWRGWGSTLVECKASVADFRADKNKPFRQYGGMGLQRFYLAPPGVIGVQDLPEKWGLIELTGSRVRKLRESEAFECNRQTEIILLCSALRRIGQTCPEGVSIKCYTIPTTRKATLSVEPLAETETLRHIDHLEAREKKLESEIAEWESALSEYSEYEGDDAPWDTMRAKFDHLEAQLKAAEALENFVKHTGHCEACLCPPDSRLSAGWRCTCGLSEALAQFRAVKEKGQS